MKKWRVSWRLVVAILIQCIGSHRMHLVLALIGFIETTQLPIAYKEMLLGNTYNIRLMKCQKVPRDVYTF